MIKDLKAITFDLWDTIIVAIDYSDVRINYLSNILKANSLGISLPAIRSAYRASLDAFSRCWREEQQYLSASERLDLILRQLDVSLPQSLKDAITTRFQETILISPPPLVPGARETIEELHQRYKIGLVCDSGMSPGTVMRKVMAHHDILRWFHATIFSDEVGATKPNPRIFSEALQHMVIQPQEALHVGDLLRTDIAGAKALGMKAIWFMSDKSRMQKEKARWEKQARAVQPDRAINSLTQIFDYINAGA